MVKTSILNKNSKVQIGKDVYIGQNVVILTEMPDLNKDDLGPIKNLPKKDIPVAIGRGAYIGDNSVIMPGVIVEEGAYIYPGSVVKDNVLRYSIVAGVPAREIGIRQSAFEKIDRSRRSLWQIVKLVLGHASRYFFDGFFVILWPFLIIFSWLRFLAKKILRQKPKILISPLGAPMPFFTLKAIRLQGYRADNLAYDIPKYFRNISDGFILADHKILRMLNYLTDSVFLFSWSILNYDLYEFPFSGGILAISHLRKLEYILLKSCAKKISVYGYGSDCKILSDIRKESDRLGLKYNCAMDRVEETETNTENNIRANVARAQKYADTLVAGGDLIHLGPKSIMLPLAYDLSNWKNSPLPNNKFVTIVHSTNHRSHKGTRYIINIVDSLKNKLPVKLLLLEDRTLQECQKLYPTGDIIIPNVVAGWFGLTAIEAMVIGRPVINDIRPDIAKFHQYYTKDLPVVPANPDNLAKEITRLVKNKKLRQELAHQGREFVLKYHSLEFVGKLRALIYEYIWAGKYINQEIFEKEIKKRKLIQGITTTNSTIRELSRIQDD